MDALIASAQIWVPVAGFAALLLVRAWLGAGVAQRLGGLDAYFASFGLALIAPVVAAVVAWSLGGGLAQWGPVILLFDPVSMGQQHLMLTTLAAPAAAFLLARFVFGSSDGVAYAASLAAALALMHVFGPIATFALALAIGGLIGFAERMMGALAMALAGATAFALLFAFVFAGGGAVMPLIALSLVGGLALSLIAASGRRARIPLYLLIVALPAFALSAAGPAAGVLDLAGAMPKPAIGNYGSLVILLALLPAIAAPFAAAPIWFARRVSAFLDEEQRIWVAPFAVLVELIVGFASSAALALALAAGAALFNELHEAAGGTTLLRVSVLLGQIRPAPLAGTNWWLLALLALPIAPAVADILHCATQLLLRLLKASGFKAWLDEAVANNRFGERIVLKLVWRVIQLAPSVLILLALVSAAPPIAQRYGNAFAEAGDALIGACDRTARSIEGLR